VISALFVLAAVQLTATDLRDLRCVYVFQTAASAVTGEERSAVQGTEQWFEGRLSAMHPELDVYDYVNEHFTFKKVPVHDADLVQCSQIFTDWESKEIAGTPHK
jgi:hypothetical protein